MSENNWLDLLYTGCTAALLAGLSLALILRPLITLPILALLAALDYYLARRLENGKTRHHAASHRSNSHRHA